MTDQQRWAQLWLACSPSLSYRARERVLSFYGGAEAALRDFSMGAAELAGEKACRELMEIKAAGDQAMQKRLWEKGVQAVFREDDAFPSALRDIPDAPRLLFAKGALGDEDTRRIAIVGSRRETRYGREMAFSIARELAQSGVTVVSGLAYGIDRAAHEGALAGGGRTVAVLGSGLFNIYPKEHIPLAEKIAASGGAVVSELAPTAQPLAFHFPFRNRIVSGLCAGVLLVEAREKSGTLITVTHALEQGREVFCLPGPADHPASEVPHRLIREGARLCTSAADIMEDLGWDGRPRQMSLLSGDRADLTSLQKKIYDALCAGICGYEELLTLTGLGSSALNAELVCMEVQGAIETLPGRCYRVAKQKPCL